MADAPKAFVAGYPIRHSRSPLIHSTWLKRHGIDGSYRLVEVPPDEFPALVSTITSGEWAGGNVTIPHKEAAYEIASMRDAAATAIGAVNTLWLDKGKIIGGNTDAYGFAANLDQKLGGWRERNSALVLGAGGACRAVIYALLEAGYQRITVVNRTLDRARQLAEVFGPKVNADSLHNLAAHIPDADLIVNTTSLGMEGYPPLVIEMDKVRTDAMATDIVYVPLETPFLKLAAAAGLNCCDGLGMLLHQAAPGFEHWFGTCPEVDDDLRNIVMADLESDRLT